MGSRAAKTVEVDIEGGGLELLDLPGEMPESPLVLLHEGLGAVGLWRGFPESLQRATGMRTIAFSRFGHGGSDPPPTPRDTRFMFGEGLEVLPAVLEELAVREPLLVGHSDGATIALIHAADHPVRGVVAIAPHVFVEDRTIAGIEVAREAFDSGSLAAKMGRHHRDPATTFNGWCDVWLDPEFRRFDIRPLLNRIRAPMLLIQGLEDSYGTIAQLDEIERRAGGPTERLLLPGDHSPHLEHPEAVREAIAAFAVANPSG